jgi:hypothetical protein
MEQKAAKDRVRDGATSRGAYVPPALTVLGSLEELTLITYTPTQTLPLS